MSNASDTKNGRRTLVRVWVCALVLALLTVASASSVGAYAATYASRDPEVLFIDTASGSEVSTTMDLFKNAYVNAEGQTVAASSDGTKIVAPGTSGSYEFAVRNSGGQPATYKVWAETSQNGTTEIIPLEVNLASGQSACEDLSDVGELAPGKSAVYNISWRWPYESGATSEDIAASDTTDTALGNDSATHRATYKVTLHMTAEAEYPAKGSNEHMPSTGDVLNPMLIAALAALGAVLMLIGFYIRKRRTREGGQ